MLIQGNDDIIHCCFEVETNEPFAVEMSVLSVVHVVLFIGK